MVFISKRSVLRGTLVKEAMRRQVIGVPSGTSIKKGLNALIKYKLNTILITNHRNLPEGLVSRTDIMSSFYAGFPLDMGLENIISSPPLTCFPDDELEYGLGLMQENKVHQLYVQGELPGKIVGSLTYYDIVGLLYRYCRACHRSTRKNRYNQLGTDQAHPLRVKEVMTKGVTSCHGEQSLDQIIETLAENRFGAVLIHTDQAKAAGVISKTDLVLAYGHGLSLATKGKQIMNSPVLVCEQSAFLTTALQKMILRDTKRIFVYQEDPEAIVGILSLSDAARFRSGSCKACQAGRIVAG